MNPRFPPSGFKYYKRKKQASLSKRLISSSHGKPSSSSSSSSNMNSRKKKEKEVAKKYILNLQQQVQFLEMELDFQKKLNVEEQSRKVVGSENLNEPIDTLRATYLKKSEEKEEMLVKMKTLLDLQVKENAKVSKMLELRDSELVMIRKNFNSKFSKERESVVTKLVLLEKERDSYDYHLGEKESEKKKLANELRENKGLLSDCTNQLRNLEEKISDLTKKNHFLTKELTAARLNISKFEKFGSNQLLEAEKKKNKELSLQIQQLISKNNQLELENSKLQITHRKVSLEKEEVLHAKNVLDKKLTSEFFPKIIELEKTLNKKKEEILKLLEENEKLTKEFTIEKEANNEKVLNYNNLKFDFDTLQTKVDRSKKNEHGLLEKIKSEQLSKLPLQTQIDNLKAQLENLKIHYTTQDEKNSELRKTAKLAQQEHIECAEQLNEMKLTLGEKEKKIIGATAEIEDLRKKLKIQDLLEKLDKNNLAKMVETNNSVSSNIQSLLSHLK